LPLLSVILCSECRVLPAGHVEVPLMGSKLNSLAGIILIDPGLAREGRLYFSFCLSNCNGLIILEGFIAYNPQKIGLLNDQYKYTKTQNNLYDRATTRVCQINGR